jgi:hypothetical protein
VLKYKTTVIVMVTIAKVTNNIKYLWGTNVRMYGCGYMRKRQNIHSHSHSHSHSLTLSHSLTQIEMFGQQRFEKGGARTREGKEGNMASTRESNNERARGVEEETKADMIESSHAKLTD